VSDSLYKMSADWSEMVELKGTGFLSDTAEPDRGWLEKYIPPEEQPRVRAAIADAIARKGVFELEHRVVLADGGIGWTLSRAVPVLDASGAIVEWFGAAADVSARRRAEETERENERRLRDLAGEFAQIVWETEGNGMVTTDSPSWRAYTGQTLEAWLGTGWLDAVHPDDRAYAARRWNEAVAARRVLESRFRIRRADGRWQPMKVRAVPVVGADGGIRKWMGLNVEVNED